LYVVGEGVETVGQLDMLRAMGCDEAQGYLMSRPVAEADFAECLTRDRFSDIFARPEPVPRA
jgi:EAL domain-containing protein (putative c-di-GMP-specific phosphodiesterase class I)